MKSLEVKTSFLSAKHEEKFAPQETLSLSEGNRFKIKMDLG